MEGDKLKIQGISLQKKKKLTLKNIRFFMKNTTHARSFTRQKIKFSNERKSISFVTERERERGLKILRCHNKLGTSWHLTHLTNDEALN